jgi:uncharacterized coiled-coil protein SlyX
MRPEALLLVAIPRPLMYSAEAWYMDRQILLRRLAQAEQRVAEGKAFIAQQQQMVVESERDGHDAAESGRLLEKFLKLQQSLEFDRGQILDELSEIS